MPGPAATPELLSIFPSREEMQTELVKYIQAIVDDVIGFPGYIAIGLSGGSMPKILAPVLAHIKMDVGRLRLFLVDERVVEWTDPDSNYGQWMEALTPELKKCLAPVDLIEIPYRPDKTTFPYDVCRTATAYEAKMKNHHIGPEIVGRYPKFDMVFLGMGPDGHTASLFPNSKLFRMKAETSSWFVGVDDSPKKPPQRITMSLPAINTSAHVAFICTGEDKATVLKAVLDGDGQYPAAHVNPTYGTLRYFLDTAAAAKL